MSESVDRTLMVNGRAHRINVPAGTCLSDVLRDTLGLRGTKVGCGLGECGACTVLVDGQPRMSCITVLESVDGHVETIEGVADESLPLRQKFAELGAFQCGFCTPGQIVQATALLRAGLPPDDTAARQCIRHHMSGNLCRCTGYAAIVEAVAQCAAGAARTA